MSSISDAAERLGILNHYFDIWGNRHETPSDTESALVQALGGEAPPLPWLEPVRVVQRTDHAPSLYLRPWPDGGPLTLRLTLEDGSSFFSIILGREERLSWPPEGREITLSSVPPLGYHTVEAQLDGNVSRQLYIVTPASAYLPPEFHRDGRLWGVSVQLYSLRSQRNWGIGDFSDLIVLAAVLRPFGVSCIGLNPLHELYPHHPSHASPYSPSSRLGFNSIYVDLDKTPEANGARYQTWRQSQSIQEQIVSLQAAEYVDYEGVGELKNEGFKRLYSEFKSEANSQRRQEFESFCQRESAWLEPLVRFETINAEFDSYGWIGWPEELQRHDSEAVLRWLAPHTDTLEYFRYRQWIVHEQLSQTRKALKALNLNLDLYLDLSVSVDRQGAEVWMRPELYALTASIGAPPDELNLKGQNWGLPPLIPHRLRAARYSPWIEVLRRSMAYASTLRIDHVMQVMQLYVIPRGFTGDRGAYIRYAMDELLGILALESVRNRCMIIGEDLGTVPPELRERLAQLSVLSTRVLFFEKFNSTQFKRPHEYPRNAAVTVSTHDLPTLKGYWTGEDLRLRSELALFPSEEVRARCHRDRESDRINLAERLRESGLAGEPPTEEGIAEAAHRFVAATPSALMLVQIEDLVGEHRAVNLPGTVDEHPNWRRKIAIPVETLRTNPRASRVLNAIQRERGV